MVTNKPTALFLFAHPDDEFGVFQSLCDELAKGRRVICAYLTDGRSAKVTPEQRNEESAFVLSQLGVAREDIHFVGNALSIPDAGLPRHLDAAANWIDQKMARDTSIAALYIPAWEGGHHDHDCLHAIVVTLAQQRNLLPRVRQFPLYHSHGCKSPWFKVLSPLAQNGAIEATSIPWRNRLRFLRYCLSYPTQAKTWVGLFPFVAFHYFRHGTQALQSVSTGRIAMRPHEGPLYYEQRGFFTWEALRSSLAQLRSESPGA